MAFSGNQEAMTIMDYIEHYGAHSLKETHWNIMDSMACAIIAYLPIEGFEGTRSLSELVPLVQAVKTLSDASSQLSGHEKSPRQLGNIKWENLGKASRDAIRVFLAMADTERYSLMKITDFVQRTDGQTQFAAMTLKAGKYTVISYEGSDGSLIGWLENFRLCYAYPTVTQELALDYLKKHTHLLQKNVYLVGHSKGGNMAMYAAMEAPLSVWNRIEAVHNFDGPGFRMQEYQSEKYARLTTKLTNTSPEESMVGMLLYNDGIQITKSLEHGISQHSPSNWLLFGEHFVKGELSAASGKLHYVIDRYLQDIDEETSRNFYESLFAAIMDSDLNYVDDLTELSFSEVKKIISNIHNMDEDAKKSFMPIVEQFISCSLKKPEDTSDSDSSGEGKKGLLGIFSHLPHPSL